MASSRSFGNAMSNVAANRGNVPILRIILGVAMVLFFAIALLLQIQTSEAFLLNGASVGLAPNWGIVGQPIQLAHGELSMNMAKAVIWGWGIELIYLVCVVGEVAIHGRLNGVFKTGAFVLVVLNFWTDLNYGSLPSGLGGQIAFAAITSFVVAFFGVIGLNMIWSGITDITR